MAIIFIIALATRVITNHSQANTNCNPAIDSKQNTVVEKSDSTKKYCKIFGYLEKNCYICNRKQL